MRSNAARFACCAVSLLVFTGCAPPERRPEPKDEQTPTAAAQLPAELPAVADLAAPAPLGPERRYGLRVRQSAGSLDATTTIALDAELVVSMADHVADTKSGESPAWVMLERVRSCTWSLPEGCSQLVGAQALVALAADGRVRSLRFPDDTPAPIAHLLEGVIRQTQALRAPDVDTWEVPLQTAFGRAKTSFRTLGCVDRGCEIEERRQAIDYDPATLELTVPDGASVRGEGTRTYAVDQSGVLRSTGTETVELTQGDVVLWHGSWSVTLERGRGTIPHGHPDTSRAWVASNQLSASAQGE